MSKTFKAPEGCPCGCLLPWHLFELGIGNFQHHCSCGREFGVIGKIEGVVTLLTDIDSSGEGACCPDA